MSDAAERRSLRDRIRAAATPAATLVGVALYLVSVAALLWSDGQLAGRAADLTKPDLRLGYDHAEVLVFLTALGESGRRAYALNLIIDSLMPVAFAAATVLVVARATWRWLPVLAVAPAAFLVLDLLENAAFAMMIGQYPDVSEMLVSAASPVTAVKLAAFFVGLPTLVAGVIALGVQRVQRLRRQDGPGPPPAGRE